MKNKDSKARMQMIFGILLFAFIFMAELYAIVNFPKMFIVLVVLEWCGFHYHHEFPKRL